jgi:glycosyltransferase involved in cell wall biosynthesis
MRIAIIGSRGLPPVYGGVEQHVAMIAKRLVKHGHRVTVFSHRNCESGRNEYEGIDIARLPFIKQKHLEMLTHTVLSCLCCITNKYDILHFQGVDVFAVAPLVFNRTPVVCTSHGQNYKRGKWGPLAKRLSRLAERKFMRHCSARIAVSRTLKEYYENTYNRPVFYIPNGAEIRPITDESILQRLGLRARQYILFVGRLDPTKGCDIAIEAYFRSRRPETFVVMGGSTYTNRYVSKLHRYAGKNVRFLGHQTGENYWAVLQHAKLFVISSQVEGMSIALLEAMGQGLPVIYSDIPENEEVVHGVGQSFKSGNVNDLAQKMNVVLNNCSLMKALGEKAQSRILEQYNWDSITSQLENIYRSVIG